MVDLGRSVVVLGLVLVAVGLAMMVLPRIPWLGRLPGDIHLERDGVSFHFPLVTCLVVSAIATLLVNLLSRK
jgi:Zn-dependent protease with chaperone function